MIKQWKMNKNVKTEKKGKTRMVPPKRRGNGKQKKEKMGGGKEG